MKTIHAITLLAAIGLPPLSVCAQANRTAVPPQKIIIDTDIGDDIDDAFAIVLALRSPEFQVLGLTTTFGDTQLRARLLDRLLKDTGNSNIPVASGIPTSGKAPFSQHSYAEASPVTHTHEDATAFLQRQIKQAPGEITLVAIGPLDNIGALIDKDLATFRKLKRVVLMGGSIDKGYGDLGTASAHGPDPEWNIVNNIPAARKLFASGVPLYVLPLDSTQLKLEDAQRARIFHQASAYTGALQSLYTLWGQPTPTLFDPMTLVWLLQPSLCAMQPIRIHVDDKGFTRREPGTPNAQVCLHSDPEAFFRFFVPRLLAEPR